MNLLINANLTTILLVLVAAIILLCVLAEKFSDKLGMPALMMFMFIGMIFGSDGLFRIYFDNFTWANNICSIALIFIMFYGGFNTKWKAAKEVAVKAVSLSTLGVIATAVITMFMCHYFLHIPMVESFLIGAVLSCTDAASVFAILRKKKLNLKDGTASILEVESGSNDPVAYMLTMIAISMMGSGESGNILVTVFLQLAVGILVGVIYARLSIHVMTKTTWISEGLDTIFVIGSVILCYGVTDVLKGNAYLSIYLMGIIVGNSNIKHKQELIPFFDGITSLAQILIFFLLGLLTFPSQMPVIIPTAVTIVLFLTIVARPITIFLLMIPQGCSVRQCLLIAWAGLRGASSSVFAIMAVAGGITMEYDLFHIVFMVSLFSVGIQGTLLPYMSKKLDMVDENADVRKTFNDYQEESAITLVSMHITEGHEWVNQYIKDIVLPAGALALMIKRENETIVTKGNTKIHAGDHLILNVPVYEPEEGEEELQEVFISKSHPWCDKKIRDLNLKQNELIVMILREAETIIPNGQTKILEDDMVVTYR